MEHQFDNCPIESDWILLRLLWMLLACMTAGLRMFRLRLLSFEK